MNGVPETADPAATWLQRLAAAEPSGPLPDAQVLWWRAQALRRLDQQRRVAARLERSELLQAGYAVAATLALFLCLLNIVSERWLPTLVLCATACGVLVGVGLAISVWDERRSVRD